MLDYPEYGLVACSTESTDVRWPAARMSDLTALTIAGIRDGLAAQGVLRRRADARPIWRRWRRRARLNAYIVETPEKALAMAADSDARIAAGEARPLEGVPLGIKDLFCTEGVHSQAASHILDGFKPTYESTVTANLWADGAVMLGKLNMDEFAMGSSNETSYYGPVVNPWRVEGLERAAGAGRLVGRLGGGGRGAPLRRRHRHRHRRLDPPAGRVHRHRRHQADLRPLLALGHRRLRLVARPGRADRAHVRDAAILLRSMASVDPKDTTSVDLPVPDYEAAVGQGVKGLQDRHPEGIPRRRHAGRRSRRCGSRARPGCSEAGAEIVDISLPHTKYALPAYYIVAPAEASSNLARYDGVRYGLRVPGDDIIDMYEKTRAAGFGKEVKRRILIGTYVLSAGYYDAYYLRAQKVRTLIKRDFETVFAAGVDAILTPATPTRRLRPRGDGAGLADRDVSQRRLHRDGEHGRACRASPCRPASTGDGLPLGLQLIGQPVRRGDAVPHGAGDRGRGRAGSARSNGGRHDPPEHLFRQPL